ncbi:hypothetical protein Tco_1052899 [Tanacetum coccineum]
MSTPTFAETHNLVAFLEKPSKSKGFEQIIDFINASSIKYALTMNPTIYTSYVEQFWTSVKVKTINEGVWLQALVDEKKIIVNEASIRRDLRLDDAKGTACLPNATIFEELARMGEVKEVKLRFPKMIYNMKENVPNWENKVLNHGEAKTAQAKEIASLKKRVKKLENKMMSRTTDLKILKKVGIASKVESSEDVASLSDQEGASK